MPPITKWWWSCRMAERGFYTDMAEGYRYWTMLSEELPQIVGNLFPISRRREDTFAAGLSMGGYGALKLALRCPDRFAGAVAPVSGDRREELVFRNFPAGDGGGVAPDFRFGGTDC